MNRTALLLASLLVLTACEPAPPAPAPAASKPDAAKPATPPAEPKEPAEPAAADKGGAAFALGERLLNGEKVALDLAAAEFEKACTAGHARGCASLGLLVQDGRGTQKHEPRAKELYQKACDLGAGVGCFNLGLMALTGNGADKDPDAANKQFVKAHDVYTKACDTGDGGACLNLAFLYEQGMGVEKDEVKARALDKKGCEAGEQDACASGALLALKAGEKEALAPLALSCKKGSPVGCRILAQLKFRGAHGVEKNVDQALDAAQRGCNLGERSACSFLGALLGMANGPVDRIHPLFERACLLGDSGACLAFASSIKGKPATAGLWIVRACNIGDPEGCMYAAELPNATDEQKKARVTRACQMSFPPACKKLVEDGTKLPMLDADAAKMREKLCADGVKKACAAKK